MSAIPGESAHSSLIGDRKINQDRCILVQDEDTVLLGLADGMGGHPRGEAAAQVLIDTCQHYFDRTPHPILNPNGFLTRLLHKAHENIIAFGYDQQPAIDPRTTAVACLIQKNIAHWAHAGDSRLYLLRERRVLSKTIDHSYVERLKQQGVITAKEQEVHPQRNYVTRCLGGSLNSPEVTLGKQKLEAGDILLLCSDGLWGSITETDILNTLFSNLPLSEAVHALAEQAAHKAFPDSDNITLIALKMAAQKKSAQKPRQTESPETAEESNLAQAIAELQNAINNFETETKQEKK
ncbi:MAG: protein phosphatase 2C domain-containing protein [Sedimenticola sp.]|uniref:Serine/threonine-protein phosphatase n=1 Tax=Sedimenticola thiotaurini TaxID=1543721 RepID=A0A558CS08_9GAMM|nr:protein phosphatase 2C domain-containing protein [Sedimenticola sp.]MCW8975350.1 protein phosphatase 2C domain-containing protein [Sedimenticola sp.]TVT51549.1 MAG: serine/threonine-protein phosphatase [Sedimenticola thiotaurini]